MFFASEIRTLDVTITPDVSGLSESELNQTREFMQPFLDCINRVKKQLSKTDYQLQDVGFAYCEVPNYTNYPTAKRSVKEPSSNGNGNGHRPNGGSTTREYSWSAYGYVYQVVDVNGQPVKDLQLTVLPVARRDATESVSLRSPITGEEQQIGAVVVMSSRGDAQPLLSTEATDVEPMVSSLVDLLRWWQSRDTSGVGNTTVAEEKRMLN